jgi:hypothetical protein
MRGARQAVRAMVPLPRVRRQAKLTGEAKSLERANALWHTENNTFRQKVQLFCVVPARIVHTGRFGVPPVAL